VIAIAYAHGPYFLKNGVDVVKNALNASFHAREMINVNAATKMPTNEVSVSDAITICL